MAKIHLDRLRKRFGWTGESYRKLMDRIVAEAHKSVTNSVSRMEIGRMKLAAKKAGWKEIGLPQIADIAPKKTIMMRKAAEQGALISDAMRERLSKSLRLALEGQGRGPVSRGVINNFRSAVDGAFGPYTTIDERYGVPPQVQAIAETEVRSVVNEVKHSYFERLAKDNPKMKMKKRWVHHPRLSRDPRPGHVDMNGREIDIDDLFEVPEYQKEGGDWVRTGGMTLMAHPHDPHAGPEDVINCHCDMEYLVRRGRD